jgi:hypothetical protein
MQTSEIRSEMSKIENFIGVYALDDLPKNLNLPITLIANTDKRSQPGTHWIAIYIDETGLGEYFDSFGLPPLQNEFYTFMDKSCQNGWYFSTVLLQDLRSLSCGQYCMLYCALRSYGFSLCSIIRLFSNSGQVNEDIVTDIYKAIFKN